MNRHNATTIIDVTDLTVNNQTILALSNRFGWKPATLVRRIKNTLPMAYEQNAYLIFSSDWPIGILPETFSRVLNYLTNGQGIKDEIELGSKEEERVNELGYRLDKVFSIVDTCREQEVSIGWMTAACFVAIFGDFAEEVVEMIIEESDVIIEEVKIRTKKRMIPSLLLQIVAKLYVNSLIGHPNVLTVEDVITSICNSAGYPNHPNFEDIDLILQEEG